MSLSTYWKLKITTEKYNKQQIIRLKNGEDKKERETQSSRGFNQ